mgnify:CR=1 FL=1
MTTRPDDAELHRDGNDVRLVFRRRLDATPERVWRAITDPEELSAWYPLRVVAADMRPGGTIEFVDDESNVYRAAIREFDVGRRFSFCEEDADIIDIDLVRTDDGTIITFTHTFAEGPPPANPAAGWHRCLENLAAVAAGRPPSLLTRDLDLERAYEQQFQEP